MSKQFKLSKKESTNNQDEVNLILLKRDACSPAISTCAQKHTFNNDDYSEPTRITSCFTSLFLIRTTSKNIKCLPKNSYIT